MGLFDLGTDWSEVEAPAFQNVPAGIYEATVAAIDVYEKDDGQKSYIFDYLITGDEANDGKYLGRTVREFKRFTDKDGNVDMEALGYVKARLINLGVPEDANIAAIDEQELIDAEVVLTLKQNKEYINVSRVELIGESTISAPAAKAAPAAAAAASTDEDDDDNPFA